MATEQKLFTTPNGAVVDATSGSLVQASPNAINSTMLQQQPAYDFRQASPTPVFPVSSIPDAQLTQQETKASDMTTRLQELNSQLLGQSEFRAQQEQAQGLPELQNTQNELSSRLTAIKNEAMAIPLQLQQESIGRGRTVGGLRPIETAALRNNAIQALSTSSLLEASRGNLALAQDRADKAVAQKYDPIKEQIAVTQANIDLILKDPRTSLEDKNRAAQQKAIQDARAAQVAQLEANQKEVLSIAQIAAKNGADGALLSRIQSYDDPEQALTAAAGFMQDPKSKLELQKLKQDIYYTRLKNEAELKPANVETASKIDGVSSVLATSKVGQGTKTAIGTIMGVLNAAESMANNSIATQGGKFPGIGPANAVWDNIIPGSIRDSLRSKAGTEFVGYINGINLKIQQWASGAALTEEQTRQVAKLTPNKNDTDANVKIKLNNLYNFMQDQIRGQLQSEGIDYEPEKVDLFAPKTLSEILK